jgi:hypothetical protein
MKNALRELLVERRLDLVRERALETRRVLGTLLSLTYDADPLIAWRAVEAMGEAAEALADGHRHYVREHLRRLFWLITEESGAICWRAPEGMAEVVRRRPDLFGEYVPIVAHLLVEMAEEDLQHFRPGILWAMGRLGPLAADVMADVGDRVLAALDHGDAQVRGMAVWCLGEVGRASALAGRYDLASDRGEVILFHEGTLRRTTVAGLLSEAVHGVTPEG